MATKSKHPPLMPKLQRSIDGALKLRKSRPAEFQSWAKAARAAADQADRYAKTYIESIDALAANQATYVNYVGAITVNELRLEQIDKTVPKDDKERKKLEKEKLGIQGELVKLEKLADKARADINDSMERLKSIVAVVDDIVASI